ncbi:FAD-dependent oxidoreductase [Nonomuraea sp. NPDC049152]|uniref:NAD(P)/FAD-dependent oxidoreductase n=1 Tax=Nonomuraea sp. NPDC049152 TaxID=3154350 RepID=UPI0033CA3FCF
MRSAEVVIIGGGCVGTSTAHHLIARGCKDVVLLEAETLGAGSTSKAAGGIRLQHADELNARMVQRSLAEFLRFEELTGVPIGFKQVGYLFLLSSEEDVDAFRRAVTAQRALGIPSEVVDLDTVRRLVPQVETGDLAGATFCPSEGYATPEAVVQGYAKSARRGGATVQVGCRVTSNRSCLRRRPSSSMWRAAPTASPLAVLPGQERPRPDPVHPVIKLATLPLTGSGRVRPGGAAPSVEALTSSPS